MLSEYSKALRNKYDISIGQVHKLIPTSKNKEKYVLHYRNLQLYLDLGLKLKGVDRVLEFDQLAQTIYRFQYGKTKRCKKTHLKRTSSSL